MRAVIYKLSVTIICRSNSSDFLGFAITYIHMRPFVNGKFVVGVIFEIR